MHALESKEFTGTRIYGGVVIQRLSLSEGNILA